MLSEWQKSVIVKNLAAIQNFGSMDILCSDKTGTLTSGDMTLDQAIDLTGNHSEDVLLLAYLNSLYGTEFANSFNIAVLKRTAVNPLDAAILKGGHPDVQAYIKIDEIPFDFERRRSSVVVGKGSDHYLITKGAPEGILNLCTQYEINGATKTLDEVAHQQCADKFHELSQDGYRVLAVAYRKMNSQAAYHVVDEKNLIFAGFIMFADPPLPDVAETITRLKHAGVNIKIITGDNELVAGHVYKAVGLDPGKILSGDEIEHMTTPATRTPAEQTRVFARIAPAQKQHIISVAFTPACGRLYR